jgi:Fic family protein
MALKSLPLQRRWVDALQQIQLKREVAGTSRIEGATFSDRELEQALKETPEQLHTRSQKQAAAATSTYRWISTIPMDMPIKGDLICEIHRHIVTGADDDHCAPGRTRWGGVNVNFGIPRHRGAEGGSECDAAFGEFTKALVGAYRDHDPIIQAMAAHYHFAAMHPFQDGNGRTARALEALMLQRAGLRDSSFIAMSNYYYDEKQKYLAALAEVRQKGHDLTPFLQFALKGISLQCQLLLKEIHQNIAKALVRNVASEMLSRLKTKRKAVLAKRQFQILDRLLDAEQDSIELDGLMAMNYSIYGKLKNPWAALVRDLINLRHLGAIKTDRDSDGHFHIALRLEWPSEITETEFFRRLKEFPKAKTLEFLDSD